MRLDEDDIAWVKKLAKPRRVPCSVSANPNAIAALARVLLTLLPEEKPHYYMGKPVEKPPADSL